VLVFRHWWKGRLQTWLQLRAHSEEDASVSAWARKKQEVLLTGKLSWPRGVDLPAAECGLFSGYRFLIAGSVFAHPVSAAV